MSLILHPVQKKTGLQGRLEVPGDKSISHRALLLGALAKGETEIENLLESEDVYSTQRVLKSIGCEVREENVQKRKLVRVYGKGPYGFHQALETLDCGNSGTTIRLLMGILAGQAFQSVLSGDASLRRRPMKRIAEPLRKMGAQIELSSSPQGQGEENFAPIRMIGTKDLRAIQYELPLASAQLKSALLLAGLFANGTTELSGFIQSRDHTERMLPHFGAPVEISSKKITLSGLFTNGGTLHPVAVLVPGDFSSAAFWIGAALLVPGSVIEIDRVSLNSTRTGLLDVLKRMGVHIDIDFTQRVPEPVGKLRIESQNLKATSIQPDEVPFLIDEIPLFAILATQAEGRTEVRGASELRVKEADRIEAVTSNLRLMGIHLETYSDGFAIQGPQKLIGAKIHSMADHRIAMAFSVAALIAEGSTEIDDAECVKISYPGFYESLRRLGYSR